MYFLKIRSVQTRLWCHKHRWKCSMNITTNGVWCLDLNMMVEVEKSPKSKFCFFFTRGLQQISKQNIISSWIKTDLKVFFFCIFNLWHWHALITWIFTVSRRSLSRVGMLVAIFLWQILIFKLFCQSWVSKDNHDWRIAICVSISGLGRPKKMADKTCARWWRLSCHRSHCYARRTNQVRFFAQRW